MSAFWTEHFRVAIIAAALLFTIGLYCIFATHHLIRTLIGIELLTKSATLLLVLAGALTGRTAAAQAMTITFIVVEVVAVVVAAGLVLGNYRHNGTVGTEPLDGEEE
jgi:NADH:ubiquinone oxidoreductase subunit K